MRCSHKKDYSYNVLLSNPPQISWTCKKCGEKGFENYKAFDLKFDKRLVEKISMSHN